MNHDDFDLETEQFVRQGGKAFPSSVHPSIFDADVLPRDPSEVTQALPECPVPADGTGMRLRKYRQEPDPADFFRLLRRGGMGGSQNCERCEEDGGLFEHGSGPGFDYFTPKHLMS